MIGYIKCGCGKVTDHKICKRCDTVMGVAMEQCPDCGFKKATPRCRKCAAQNLEEKQKECFNLLEPGKKLLFAAYLRAPDAERDAVRTDLLEGLPEKERDMIDQFTVARGIYRNMRA